jgi:hypothetical protein
MRLIQSPLEVFANKIGEHRSKGNARGRLVNISKDFDEHISLKKGFPTFITGAPHDGKSELGFEVVLNDIVNNDTKWLILSPETGNTVELYSLLAEKYYGNGKRIFKSSKDALTDEEVADAFKYFQSHIRTIDPTEDWSKLGDSYKLNLKNLFEIVDHQEKELGAKFDGILIDPFNEIESEEGKPIYQAVKDEVQELILYGKQSQKTIVLVIHANDTQPILKGSGDAKWYYYPPARPQDLQGGQQFFRKGYQIMNYYRPQKQLLQEMLNMPEYAEVAHKIQHGIDNENIAFVKVQKSKPKFIGKLGQFFLFYDVKRQRFYDIDQNGTKYYSNGEKEEAKARLNGKWPDAPKVDYKDSEIGPNTDFLNTKELPF